MTVAPSTPLARSAHAAPADRAAAPAPPTMCDAVGLADADARRVMELLPRVGCVLADAGRWWWLVPSQSDIGIAWPPMARYEVGAFVPPAPGGQDGPARPDGARLIHSPDGALPYTHPLLLYVAVCAVAGIDPAATGPATGGDA